MKKEIEKHYQKRAEEFIDSLYDNGYFIKEVTRKDMRAVEDLLAFLFQSGVESALKGQELLRVIRNIKS